MLVRSRAFAAVVLVPFLFATKNAAAVSGHSAKGVAHAVKNELVIYGHDFGSMAVAPLHWDRKQWIHFGEGAGAIGALYAADRPLYDAVQRNRSHTTDQFADVVTPFGARRAENISLGMILWGSMRDNERLTEAGRDSLESEIWAGGIVTPLLKASFGRARPSQGEGASSFHPITKEFASFPSGHSTNAWAFASAIAAHYDGWRVPTLLYTIASGVSISRVNDKAHFFSDVLAGALIGRTVARGVVHRHQGRDVAWSVTPAMFDGSPMLEFRLSAR